MHITHLLFGGLIAGSPLVCVELLARRYRLHTELSRKTTHVASCLAAIIITLFCNRYEIMTIAALFVIILLITRRQHLWKSLYGIDRKSWGEVLLPVGIFIVAAAANTTTLYIIAVAIAGLADTIASLAGQRFGKRTLPFGSSKTYVGCALCAGVSYFIAASLSDTYASPLLFGLGISCAVAEAVAPYGSDNISLPLTAVVFLNTLQGPLGL